jgi:hypothetical protein
LPLSDPGRVESPRKKAKVWLSLVSAALALVAVEASARLWLSATSRPWDRARVVAELALLREQVLGSSAAEVEHEPAEAPAAAEAGAARVVQPYVGFDLERTARNLERDLALHHERGAEAFEVLLLGGSVAANFGYHGREPLLEVLASDPRLAGRELLLYNYARAAHKQPQQVNQANYLFALGLRPDAVIDLDGFNELAVASMNARRGVHPALPASEQWLPLVTGSALDSRTLELTADVLLARNRLLEELDACLGSAGLRSALVGSLLVRSIDRRRGDYSRAVERLTEERDREELRGLAGPTLAEGDREPLETCVRIWREGTLSLAAACAARGITYLHVLQPTLHDAGSKPLSADERATGKAHPTWETAAREGYPLLRAEGAQLRAGGLAFFDASGVFRERSETLYFDACHFRAPGHELLARAIGEALLLELPE